MIIVVVYCHFFIKVMFIRSVEESPLASGRATRKHSALSVKKLDLLTKLEKNASMK
jgi:hypothetical protein